MTTQPPLNDEEVIRMYLNTQQNDYFEELYHRYVSKVYSRCLSLTKDTYKAEDYTQDIFLRVYSNLGKFKENSAFSTWLYSISYNYCMDQLRSANRTATLPLDEQPEPSLTESGDQETEEAQRQRLALVMNSITPGEKRLLQLRYEEGLDVKAIAQQLAMKESAVKMRLKRTRDKIRRLYSN